MAVSSDVVTVSTSATRLDTADDRGTRGKSIATHNDGPETVFVGGPGVTAATGFPVAADAQGPTFDLDEGESIWAVTEQNTADVRTLERGI